MNNVIDFNLRFESITAILLLTMPLIGCQGALALGTPPGLIVKSQVWMIKAHFGDSENPGSAGNPTMVQSPFLMVQSPFLMVQSHFVSWSKNTSLSQIPSLTW